jgi:hypothetical protein
MQMSFAICIVISVSVIGVVIAVVTFIRPHTGAADLGPVSEQWMAQHRAGPAHDLQR